MSGGVRDLAGVLASHEPDVTSYDAGDIHGCRCGWELPPGLGWDDKWPAYHAHVAEHLERVVAEARAEALREVEALLPGFEADYGIQSSPVARLRAVLRQAGDGE